MRKIYLSSILTVFAISFLFVSNTQAQRKGNKQTILTNQTYFKSTGSIRQLIVEPTERETKNAQASEIFLFTTDDGRNFTLEGKNDDLARYRNAKVEIEGISLGKGRIQPTTVKAVELPNRINQFGSGITPTVGTRSVLVIQANFSNDTSQPETAEQVRNKLYYDSNSTRKFFQQNSDFRFDLSGIQRSDIDITPWVTLTATNANCEQNILNSWMTEANTIAIGLGFQQPQYQIVIYRYPQIPGCTVSPLGSVGTLGDNAPGQIVVSQSNSLDRGVVAHEIGHNIGMQHASGYGSCSGTNIPVDCTVVEYGDRADTMGSGGFKFYNNVHRQKLGWLNGSNKVVAYSGTYRMKPPTQLTKTPQSIQIHLKNASGQLTGYSMWLEVRKNLQFDEFSSQPEFVTGLSIRYARTDLTFNDKTYLVDTNASTSTFNDAPLMPGETFTDSNSGVTIQMIQGNNPFLGAKVNITLTR